MWNVGLEFRKPYITKSVFLNMLKVEALNMLLKSY